MGHHVDSFAPETGLEVYQKSPVHRAFRRIFGVSERRRRAHCAALISAAENLRPNIAIVLKGLQVDKTTIQALSSLKAWAINVNHDDFFSRNPNNRSDLQWDAIPFYAHIFTTREVNVAELLPQNRNVAFFPFAYYPRIHRPVDTASNPLWQNDVVFVGTWEAARCRMLEKLVARVPAKYALFGSQWRKAGSRSPVSCFLKFGEVVMDDLARALGGSKIALGFLRKENRDDYTQRTFEIPACRGVLLAERTARQMSWFRPGIEAEYFDADNPDELCEKVRYLLAHADYRESLRERGHQTLLSQKHTYRDRMELLFERYAAFKGRS